MPFLSYTEEARDTYYKQRNPQQAEEQLRPHLKAPKTTEEKRAVYELMGLILRSQNKFKEAVAIYEQIRDYYQAGYCELLQGNFRQAEQYWEKLLPAHQNHWCITLHGLITQQLRTYPTLF